MIFLSSTSSSSKSVFVMVVSHRQTSAPIAPPGHLHRSLDASGLADCSFLLYCVSPRNSPRTSPCLGRRPLVCLACCCLCSCLACCWLRSSACCWLCSFACCWLCSSGFLSSFLPFSTLSAALRAHRRFDVLLAVLVPVLLLYLLFTTGSPAVVLSRILTTCSLAVVLSRILTTCSLAVFLLYFSLTTGFLALALSLILTETLCGRLHLPGCLACTSNTTTRRCALRDRWLAVGARAPWSCSLQQRVLLTMRTGLRGRCRCFPLVVSNTTPTPLCASLGCVHPHYEGLHRGLLPRRGPSVRPALLACHRSSCLSRLVSFTGLATFTRYFSSRVLMTFFLFLVIVTCFTMSFALRSDATARHILDASLLHCTRAAVPTLLNCADQSFCWMRNSVFSFLFTCC